MILLCSFNKAPLRYYFPFLGYLKLMASLVESASDLLGSVDEDRMRYMAFSEAMLAAEEFASPLYDFHEETWHELYVRPSPPVTPSCLSPTPAAPVVPPDLDRNGLDMAEALLCNIMEYEQVMDALHDAEFALSSSQTPDDMLIQDCMWSGSTCEETKGNSGAVDDKAILQPDSSNCIEPAVVFPSLTSHVSTEPQSVSIPESTRSVSLRLPSAGSLQSDGSGE
jgi:Myc proto-oncogene protein